ncbi:cortical protein marker for cell polarity-domain-containing protein, partial [Jimgerdemannia flammicorona]
QLPPFSTVNDIETSTGDLYIGGRFVGSTGYSNIVKYTYSPTPRLNLLSSGGLNGNVSVLTLVNGDLFVGGSFSATANNSHKLNNVARYTITNNTNQWHSLESGVNGPVTTIVPLTGTTSQTPHARLHISGNFTQLISTSFSGQPELSTGYALWNTATNAWQASPPGVPFIDGTASVILPYINATNASNIMQATFFAGRLSGAQNLQAFGLSSLNSNETSITPGLSPYPLFDPTSFFASSANTTPFTVNAGVFWTDPNNGNASVTIVGGSFQITEGVRDLAFYENGTWSGAIGTPWVGVVDALAIYNNTLYIGGVFNVSTSNGALMSHSIVAWDLLRKTYLPLSDLSTNSGAEARVHVLQFRPDTGLLIVAGLFDKAGSLPCSGVCSFDTSKMQWYALGLGIQGEARDLDFVDSSVYVAGDLSLNGASVRVAQFDFNSQQWSPLGPQTGDDSLPGPAVAVTYDHITGKTFIAGSSVNGSYLRQYDGSKYIVLTPELKPNTYITQLFVVPATPQNASAPENNVIKKDTMLMVAGLLDIPGFGNVSAALFDGVDWYPYLVATGASGGPGVINSIFFKNCCPLSGGRSFLPIPIVILISIAIALGLVFFIVLVALAILYLKRKREAQQNPNPRPESYYGKPPRRPQSLLAMLGPGADNVLNNPEKTAAAAAAARSDSRASHRRPDSGLAHEMVESAVVSGALSGAGSTAAIASYRNGSRDHLQQPDPARPDSEIFQSIYATDRPESQDYYSSFAPIGRSSAMRTESTDYSIAFGSEYESISALAVAPGSRSETAADFSTYYSDEPGTDMGLRDSAASEFGSLSTPVRGFAAMMTAAAMNDTAVPASEDHPHLYYAKYQFKAREHGELGFEVGDRIVVVDTSDDIWWMGSKDNG